MRVKPANGRSTPTFSTARILSRLRYGAFTDDDLKTDLGGDRDAHDLAGYESEFGEDV